MLLLAAGPTSPEQLFNVVSPLILVGLRAASSRCRLVAEFGKACFSNGRGRIQPVGNDLPVACRLGGETRDTLTTITSFLWERHNARLLDHHSQTRLTALEDNFELRSMTRLATSLNLTAVARLE